MLAKSWQAQVSYQYGYATEFYVGDQRDDTAARFGIPPTRKVNLVNFDLMYGLTNRLSLDLAVPFVWGSGTAEMGSPASHNQYQFSADGLGDMSLQAEYWLNDPTLPSNLSGSVALAVRAPTGKDDVQGTVNPGTGDVQGPIDEAYQLGSGGWGVVLFAQGMAKIRGPLFGYASGWYLISLKEHTEVINGGALRGVPDTYSGRLGLAYLLPIDFGGFVVSAGGRINGITVSDLVGGEDLYWRRPGYEIFVEPGLTWTLGPNMLSFSFPIRAYAHKLDSPLDVSLNRHIGADFVPYLLQLSYARRF